MQNTSEKSTNANFLLDNHQIDLTRKYDKSSTLPHKLITLAGFIVHQENIGNDWCNWNLYKDRTVFGRSIQFEDFCEVLTNYKLYKSEFIRLVKIKRKRRYDLEPWSTDYKLPTIINRFGAIKRSDNPYQLFYDNLQLYYFFYYIDYTISDLRDFSDYTNFQIVPIKEEDKHFYFKTTWRLLEIMFNPILSHDDKQFILNKQYTLCDKIRNSTKSTQIVLRKENIFEEIIPKTSQRILLEEFRKRCVPKSAPHKLSNLYRLK